MKPFDPSRTAIARMTCVRRRLLAGEPFNATKLAGELDVSTKTVHRDIEFMRVFLGYEITWDGSRKSFVGSVPALPIL